MADLHPLSPVHNLERLRRGTLVVALAWLACLIAPPREPTLASLTVGEGLAVLYQDPSGWRMLFDTGPGNAALPELGQQLAPWDHRLDLMVISHGHSDHLDGAPVILDTMRVDEIWWPPWLPPGELTNEFTKRLPGHPNTQLTAGYWRVFAGGLVLEALHPTGPDPSHVHGNTVVLLGHYPGRQDFLLTGDLDAEDETALLLFCDTHRCSHQNTLLQVSHHGSLYSTSNAFLDWLRPARAVISVGENSYGHPGPATLERLSARSIPYLRTDQRGTIKLTLDRGP